MRQIRMRAANALAEQLRAMGAELDAATVADWIEIPPDPSLGDLALPCFRLAKTLRRSPADIASELAQGWNDQSRAGSAESSAPDAASVRADGPYLNIRLARGAFFRSLQAAAQENRKFFSSDDGRGETVAVDLSSPNIAKPFSMGHLRSTVIGTAISNLFRADGYNVLRINHLGDWGTQFGKIIVAYRRFGDPERIRDNPIAELQSLYVRFHTEAEADPRLEDEARAAFKRLEDGDPDDLKLWRWMVDVSLEEFDRTYALLGTSFTHVLGESFYNDKMDAVIEELEQKSLLVNSAGADVVMLDEYGLPPCLIRKSDGATLYATRDLAAALHRHRNLGATRLVYVVGNEQRLHFQQIFAVLDRMGYPFAQSCTHVGFGLMKLDGKKMSTRKGQVVKLQQVLDEAVNRTRAIIDEKNPGLSGADDVARAIGAGAVIFNDLKTNRLHDIDFSMETALAFDGETGPYVQYTHARACSVLRKADMLDAAGSPDRPVTERLEGELENDLFDEASWKLMKELALYPEMRERARIEFDPSLVAKHALDICQAFNHFYHDCPILSSEEPFRAFRIALTDLTRLTVRASLILLGLAFPAEI